MEPAEIKSLDDMKLEIAIEAETSLQKAVSLARNYFPMVACDLQMAVVFVLRTYEECQENHIRRRKDSE